MRFWHESASFDEFAVVAVAVVEQVVIVVRVAMLVVSSIRSTTLIYWGFLFVNRKLISKYKKQKRIYFALFLAVVMTISASILAPFSSRGARATESASISSATTTLT